MLEHTHAILIIKNANDEYLQYFDKRWNSYLFPNCKLENNNHIEEIKQYLFNLLNLNCDENQIKYATDKIHEKYSESAKQIKEYHHYFYIVNLNNVNKENKFQVNNIELCWLTISQLETNERIKKVNSDIVDIVKSIMI